MHCSYSHHLALRQADLCPSGNDMVALPIGSWRGSDLKVVARPT